MRWGLPIVLSLAAVGCASKPAPQPVAAVAQASDSVYERATVAGALLYDPPVVANAPPVDLSREGRGVSAYAGYEELTTTYYYLYQDDRQLHYGGSGNSSWRNLDRFERRAITQRVGVSYR